MSTEPPFRCPTRAAIDSLAKQLDLPNEPHMQDWQWEVADPERLAAFLSAYENLQLNEDERFCLMEIIVQSFEDSDCEAGTSPEWLRIEKLLKENFQVHAYSVWYWACFGTALKNAWRVAPAMRSLFQAHG